MIILEGPDCAGKTTLLKMLVAEMPGLKVMKRAVSSEGVALTNIKTYVQGHLTSGFQPRLFDRFALISGPIYGSLTGMSGPNIAFQDRYWHFTAEAQLLSLRPVIVYCLPPLPVIRTNLQNDLTSAKVVADDLDSIYYQYQARAARDFAMGIASIYDYTAQPPITTLLTRIQTRLEQND